MMYPGRKYNRYWMAALMIVALLSSCGSSPNLIVKDLEAEQSVKLYLNNGKTLEGLVIEQSTSELTLVDQADHKEHVVKTAEIRRAERSSQAFDFQANPISDAEISRNKSNRNAWGSAVGGAAIGMLTGLAIGVPIWLVAETPPPLFVGGLGSVGGTIFFGMKGIRKDRDNAITKVRYTRKYALELEAEKAKQREKLRELEEQKAKLKQKLKEKDNKSVKANRIFKDE